MEVQCGDTGPRMLRNRRYNLRLVKRISHKLNQRQTRVGTVKDPARLRGCTYIFHQALARLI